MSIHPPLVTVNGRSYRWPTAPTVVICLDGSETGYIETAIDKGLAPHLARLMREGANLTALSVIPSFTNPNRPCRSAGPNAACLPIIHVSASVRYLNGNLRMLLYPL